jgi:phenylalanyl-tRNA synthetase beta chain
MQVRPLVSCAILRNIKFTKERYDSFIALQDKLHANLARQRTLVSIGTHDLDTIKGPFTYSAEPPEKIKFIPLNQTKEMNAAQLMTFYEKDKHLGKFLHIIRDKPVYPVIRDASGTVLSLPPIINGEHSKITLKTTNVLIEITAVDKAKVEIVNKILVAMFSRYCAEPFTVEPVQVQSPHNGETRKTPDLKPRPMTASVAYINSCTGLTLSAAEQSALLGRMGLAAKPDKSSADVLRLDVPITRADVLHQADIMEDVAVAYGFNNLPRHYAPSAAGAAAVGAALPLNKLADIARNEAARAGWREALPLILCSHDENFAWLRRADDGTTAVRLLNPKSAEYQVVRTSLVPGLLKTLRENRHRPLPVKIFEASDVVFKDATKERKTRNQRNFAAAFCGKTSGFELVHGLLDRVMLTLGVPFLVDASEDKVGYWIEGLEREFPSLLGKGD